MRRLRSWWADLGRSNQIALIGVLVALFIGLVGAVPTYLLLRESTAATASSPATTFQPGPTTTAAAQDRKALRDALLATVPEDVKATCFSADDRRFFSHADVSFECASEGVAALHLALFSDRDTLYDHYNRATKQADVKRDSGALNCGANKPGEGAWTEEGADAGRYLCYVDANRHAWLHWTYDKYRVYGYVYRQDANMRALDQWWNAYYASAPG